MLIVVVVVVQGPCALHSFSILSHVWQSSSSGFVALGRGAGSSDDACSFTNFPAKNTKTFTDKLLQERRENRVHQIISGDLISVIPKKLHLLVLFLLGGSTPPITPKDSQRINWRNEFHLCYTRKLSENNCVILMGPMVCACFGVIPSGWEKHIKVANFCLRVSFGVIPYGG